LIHGENVVEIRYECYYVQDCQGMHSYTDPEDGEEYHYSQFEAADAHKAFPCFDQPDLKAPYTLMAIIPRGWTAISTGIMRKSVESGSKDFRNHIEKFDWDEEDLLALYPSKGSIKPTIFTYEFTMSPKLSTYLYSLVVGPYVKLESDKEEIITYRFPLKLYCRKSLAEHLKKTKEEYFHITKCGIDYYEELFGIKYPFKKMD